jgi:hypothetical protein
VITGEIHSLSDGLRVVAAMMRHHHSCGSWVRVAERLERVAADPDVCPRRRDDAVRAAVAYLAGRELAEVAA